MNLMALDLELNQPSRKIIEIGVCFFNLESGEVLEKCSWYINPNEPINPYITDLTTITDEDVIKEGITLLEAYNELVAKYKKHNCFGNMLTWGGGDSEELKQELSQYGNIQWEFGRRWFDVKTLYQAFCMREGHKIQAGLAKALTRVGLQFKGTKHRAIDDAFNTYRMFSKLIKLLPKGVITTKTLIDENNT